MSLQHYLPATFIAGFSPDLATLPRRDRVLVAGDKQRHTTFRAPASRLAAENNLYTMDSEPSDRDFVDATWGGYESGLAEAIADLVHGTVTAKVWTRTLVPFVAALMVRGVDFEHRLRRRLEGLPEHHFSKDQTNFSRLFELQRVLASVLAAEWHIFEVSGPGDLILPDVGYAPSHDPATGGFGLAIPLGPRHLLRVHPCQTRAILRFSGTDWFPLVLRSTLPPEVHQDLVRVLATGAMRFIFGGDEATVRGCLTTEQFFQRPDHVDLGFVDSARARVHEFTWHRLVSMLEADKPRSRRFDSIDPEVLKRGWCPFIFFPSNLPAFEPGLAVIGREIIIHLYDVAPGELNAVVDELERQRSRGLEPLTGAAPKPSDAAVSVDNE